jgi:hypothetical protein
LKRLTFIIQKYGTEVTSQTSNLELNGSDARYCNIEPAGELIHCKAQLIKANKIHSISVK